MIPLGTCDLFRSPDSLDTETTNLLLQSFEQRAQAPDQIALRQELIRMLHLLPGQTVVEIGCGCGILLGELAQSVAPGGTVYGVEPNPDFAAAARKRLGALQLPASITVFGQRAEELGVPEAVIADGIADACVAQTVLIHLQPEILRRTLAEMLRMTRAGGRIASVDQDGDTWVIDHPDRTLTRRIIQFHSDQRYADGWTGRSLKRIFAHAGLEDVTIQCRTHCDTAPDSYLFSLAERIAHAAAEARVITMDEANHWIARLHEQAKQGQFFSSMNYYLACGVRPLGKR